MGDEQVAMMETAMSLVRFAEQHRAMHQQDLLSFECKTCRKGFTSAQALGGHRASHSHKRAKFEDQTRRLKGNYTKSTSTKPRRHPCPVCRYEFSTGQALGGHMRKHRQPAPAPATEDVAPKKKAPAFDLNLPLMIVEVDDD